MHLYLFRVELLKFLPPSLVLTHTHTHTHTHTQVSHFSKYKLADDSEEEEGEEGEGGAGKEGVVKKLKTAQVCQHVMRVAMQQR